MEPKDYIGKPLLEETREQQVERVRKAMEHERSFGKKQETDIVKKRMDSDLFKSENLGKWV